MKDNSTSQKCADRSMLEIAPRFNSSAKDNFKDVTSVF